MNEQRSEDRGASPVLGLLEQARWYVLAFEPRSHQEEIEQAELIQAIDQEIPAPVLVPLCDAIYCCKPIGHEGEHDDIPF